MTLHAVFFQGKFERFGVDSGAASVGRDIITTQQALEFSNFIGPFSLTRTVRAMVQWYTLHWIN